MFVRQFTISRPLSPLLVQHEARLTFRNSAPTVYDTLCVKTIHSFAIFPDPRLPRSSQLISIPNNNHPSPAFPSRQCLLHQHQEVRPNVVAKILQPRSKSQKQRLRPKHNRRCLRRSVNPRTSTPTSRLLCAQLPSMPPP